MPPDQKAFQTDGTLDGPEDAGRLRQSDDVLVVEHRDNTTLHQPPDHAELPARLNRLCAFANGDEKSTPFVHPAVRAILLHQLTVIRQATANLHAYLAHVAIDQQNTELLLAAPQSLRSHLNHRQVALITHALKHLGEKYYVGACQRTHGVVYQTVRTDLLKLASLRLATSKPGTVRTDISFHCSG